MEIEDYTEISYELLLSQFKNSPKLKSLLFSIITPFQDLQNALSELLLLRNIETAKGKQLDGVGNIVGVQRPYINSSGDWYFGFTGQSKAKGFSQAPIRDDGLKTKFKNYVYMSDEKYKRLIKWKIITNNSHGTTEDVINACIALFNAKNVEVIDNGKASISVNIHCDRSDYEPFISDIDKWIPTCTGITATANFN